MTCTSAIHKAGYLRYNTGEREELLMEFVSLLGTVVIVMLLIWLLPYLLWFFIIMGIVIWVAGFFTRRKIRKQQQSE